jgi:trimeric autotransporter adhesin
MGNSKTFPSFVCTIPAPDLSGLSTGSGPFSPATAKLIPWGTNGLAFILSNNCCGSTTTQVVLVQSPTLLLTSTKSVSSVPVATSTNPTSVNHGPGNVLMTLKGSGFVPGSVVTWNGKARSVSYMSKNEMKVYVPATALASAGAASIVVKNPAPGGGNSNTLTFTVK